MAKKTYVQLVNDAILESGADLALYSNDGTDFVTNTTSLMVKFKGWTARAWKTIQQEADDWHFLTSRGVVNTGPGIMFYTEGVIPGTVPPTVDIYDADDVIKVNALSIRNMTDLTGGYSSEDPSKNYGYVKIAEASQPVNFTLKPGNDYFYLNGRLIQYTAGMNTNLFYDRGTTPGSIVSVVFRNAVTMLNPRAFNNAATITDMEPFTQDYTRGTDGFAFTSNNKELNRLIQDAINRSIDYEIALFQYPLDSYTPYEYINGADLDNPILFTTLAAGDPLSIDLIDSKAYVHSWRSYDWNEELGPDDFTDHVKEVNQATYKIISKSSPETGNSIPLLCIPWQGFLEQVSTSQNMTSEPRFISEDSQGRWALWPHPKEAVTITFDYTRTPQVLANFDDVPQHLPSEYEDLIMWRALMFYAEYDEQPSVLLRAKKNFTDILYRFEKQKRPKFTFRPARFIVNDYY